MVVIKELQLKVQRFLQLQSLAHTQCTQFATVIKLVT